MNIQENRKRHFNIDGPKIYCHKRIESEKLQADVERWIAKGNRLEIVPMGMSSYLNDLEKANIQKNSKKYGRNTR